MSKKIVVADSDSFTINLVKTILKENGYMVVGSSTGMDCIRKASAEKPSLVLVDTLMPDLSGWDIYNRLKNKDKNIKVAFLSVIELSRERQEKLLFSGICDYIKKPFKSEDFLERVNRILTQDED